VAGVGCDRLASCRDWLHAEAGFMCCHVCWRAGVKAPAAQSRRVVRITAAHRLGAGWQVSVLLEGGRRQHFCESVSVRARAACAPACGRLPAHGRLAALVRHAVLLERPVVQRWCYRGSNGAAKRMHDTATALVERAPLLKHHTEREVLESFFLKRRSGGLVTGSSPSTWRPASFAVMQ